MILYADPTDLLFAISYDSTFLGDLKIFLAQEGRQLQQITPEEFLKISEPAGHYINLVTIDTTLRKKITEHLDKINAQRFSFVHSSTTFFELQSIGPGVSVGPNSTVDRNTILTKDIIINPQSLIGHSTVVKTGSYISPGVIVSGSVEIGEFCYIGISTTIVDKIKITDFVKTGAATVVRKNITEPGVYTTINETIKLPAK